MPPLRSPSRLPPSLLPPPPGWLLSLPSGIISGDAHEKLRAARSLVDSEKVCRNGSLGHCNLHQVLCMPKSWTVVYTPGSYLALGCQCGCVVNSQEPTENIERVAPDCHGGCRRRCCW